MGLLVCKMDRRVRIASNKTMFIMGPGPRNGRYRFLHADPRRGTLLEDFVSLTPQATWLVHWLAHVPVSSPVLPCSSCTAQGDIPLSLGFLPWGMG